MRDEHEAAVREYIAGAGRALDRGDAGSASRELVIALQYCCSIVNGYVDTDRDRYCRDFESVTREIAKLPPHLVRNAMRIIDDRSW